MKLNLIQLLQDFNSNERFYLIRQALDGQSRTEPGFIMSEQFREQLEGLVKFEIPQNAFMAMDYRLDWIHASLFLADKDLEEGHFPNLDDDSNQIVFGNVQDIDLLIAFSRKNRYYMILIEAKGYMRWGKRQLDSKTQRLDKIFKNYKVRYPNLKLYMLVISPHVPSPTRTGMEHWPDWIQQNFSWAQLIILDYIFKLTLSDADNRRNKNGGFFTIELIEGNEEEPTIPC